MATVNTFANALGKSNAALVLTNPGGNNPWLFSRKDQTGALNIPAVLVIPTTAAAAAIASDEMYGNSMPQEELVMDGKPFVVRASGLVLPSVGSLTLKLYVFYGNGEAVANPGALADVQVLLASATLPAASATVPAASNWLLELKCIWDSLSATLNIQTSGFINGTAVTSTMAQVTNVQQVQFVIGANLTSEATALNELVTLTNFTADLL